MKAGLLKTFFTLICLGFLTESTAQVGSITSNLNDTVCNGSTGLLTANGVVGSVVTWEYDIGSGFTPIPSSAGNNTQSFFQIPNNTCYRFVHNGGADVSAVYCIVVDDSSNAGSITGGGAQCGIANGNLTVSGYNGNPLGWYSSTGGPFGSLSNVTTTQTFNVTQTTYFAYITKNGTCPADTSIDTISITPYSNGGLISPTSNTICATSNTVTLNAASVVGTNLGWESAPSASGPWTSLSNTTNTYSTTNLSTTTYYHLLAKSGICPIDTSNTVQITVDQAPVGGTLSGGSYYCGTPPATGTLTLSGYTGTIVNWEFNSGSGWSLSPCTGNTCNYSVPVNTIYRVEVDNGVCPSVYSTYDTIGVSANSVAGTLSLTVDTLCAFSGGGLLSLTGNVGTTYHWEYSINNGSTWVPMAAFTGATAGYYNLPPGSISFHCIVQNNQCSPLTTNSVTVTVNPSPTVTILTNDTTLDPGQTLSVLATGTGNPTWSPANSVSSPNTFNTNVTPYLPTNYVITVDDGSGCTGTDTLHISMAVSSFTGFVANALTPNNDGINDALYIENIEGFTTNKIEIFNEYGQSIFTASPYKNDWKGTYNGSRVPDGTYYYVLTLTEQNKEKEYKGFITILGSK